MLCLPVVASLSGRVWLSRVPACVLLSKTPSIVRLFVIPYWNPGPSIKIVEAVSASYTYACI